MAGINIPSWFLPIGAAAASGIISYFGGQVTLEHRLTAIEDAATAHAREDDRGTAAQAVTNSNLWHAIEYNRKTVSAGNMP